MNLDVLIAHLRAELAAESWLSQMHGRGPAESFDFDLKGYVRSPDEGGIGRPFTGPMWRILGSPDGYGTHLFARASVQEISDWCHARHMNHQRPGDRYSLCARLVFRLVELQHPLAHVAGMLGLEVDGAERLATMALEHAARWRSARLGDLDLGPRVEPDRTTAQQFMADHDNTDWERQKWEGIREAYHLPPWHIEWERRMSAHQREGCTRCARKAAA